MSDKQLNLLGIVAIIVVILSVLSIENIGFLNIGKKSPKKGYSIVIAEKTYETNEYGKIIKKYFFIFNENDIVVDVLVNEKLEKVTNIKKYFNQNIKQNLNRYNERIEENNIKYNNSLYYRENKINIIKKIYEKNYKITKI